MIGNIDKCRQVSIKELIGTTNNKINCVFHDERTPSLVLYDDGGYHCYGCSKNGANAIDFLIDLGASFNEAILELNKYI